MFCFSILYCRKWAKSTSEVENYFFITIFGEKNDYMFLIGIGKSDITAYKEGVGMLGYGLYHHIMMGVETPLYARCFIVQDELTGQKVAIINCELCFITPSLKKGILKELGEKHPHLGWDDHNLLLSAQHTHCAPAGYSFHGLYNMNAPGFIPEIYYKIVNGIVDAILAAEAKKERGTLHISSSHFAPEIPVSFNRSIRSYNQNPEVKKLTYDERHLAVDREMTLIRFVAADGKEIGSINWFAVHTTNLSNMFLRLCSDNKGFAATYLEQHMKDRNPDYLAAFAQGACGDVSARYVYNPKLPFQRGKYEGKYADDLKSSQYNGQLQFEKALEIIETSGEGIKLEADVDAGVLYVDFGFVDIDPKFTNGKEGCMTSPSCMGVAFLEGSKMDGPGMHPVVGFFAKGLANFVKVWDHLKAGLFGSKNWKDLIKRQDKAQGNKHIALECGNRRIFGTFNVHRFFLPGFTDELIRNLKIYAKKGAMKKKPWTPQRLPLQFVKIGSLAIIGIPFEITTVASWRLRKTIEEVLFPKGFNKVILCPYTNAYSGYITTNEEYQLQDYEGGHNVFGQWSLNALQQKCHELSEEMLKSKEDRHLSPHIVPRQWTDDELQLFEHFEGYYFKRVKKKQERLKNKVDRVTKKFNRKALK